MSISTLLYITLFGMAAGSALIFPTGKKRTPDAETDGILHGIVPIIATCSYFAMPTHQGALPVPQALGSALTRDCYFARCIDWLFTTPILQFALASTATHSGRRRWGAIFGLTC